MGDRKHPGAKQQHDPYDLRDAAQQLRQLAKDMEKDCVGAFRSHMGNYTLDTLHDVAAERKKRMDHEDYDDSVANRKGVTSGATTDWLNPFGRFTEADRLQLRVDDSFRDAVTDGGRAVGLITRMAEALESAAKFYESNEDTNTELSKKMMTSLLAGGSVTSRKA